jgi:serine/threonine-protein kinase
MARSLLNSVLSRWKKFLLVAGAALLLFLLFNYVLMPAYVNHGSRLTVPNVEGMAMADARQVLEGASLVAVEAGVRPEPGQPVGTVVGQNPPAGAVVKEGRRVYLTLSGGEVLANVPALRGRSLRDAKFSLERQGLRVGDIAYASSDTYPQNTIIEQALPEDRRVPRGTPVGLTVSQGRATSETLVPMLEGKTLAEAQRILEAAGLVLGTVSHQLSADLLPNTVIDQVPAAGTSLGHGLPVDVLVVQPGKPPEEISRPRE